MKKLACLLLLALLPAAAAPPVPVIFDTDMGNDIDDALALAMLHALESRSEVRLLAVTVTKDNPWAGRYVSAVNTFYGRGNIPIGMVRDGVTREDGKYNRQTIEKGPFPYSDQTEEAVGLLRRTLEKQPDGSVVLVQVGFSSNLARLLASDKPLIQKKVKYLSIMAANFRDTWTEYNIKEDLPAARQLVAGWPTPIVWSGFEIGDVLRFPAASIERDFAWTANHPVAVAYRHYEKMPYDRQTWDLTAVLYGVRPDAGYFDLSEPGDVRLNEKGRSTFEPRAGGRDRILKLRDEQKPRIMEALILLASQPAGK
jgi:inosine-uridine nucleoside N-ribohydrolase